MKSNNARRYSAYDSGGRAAAVSVSILDMENRLSLPTELAAIATGRSADLFLEDLQHHWAEIHDRLHGRRVLVLGGAGSIGTSTVSLLTEFDVGCLHVVDQNENALAELVRDLRSRSGGLRVRDFQALPIDLGSQVMRRHLRIEPSYDLVFNFAALKHVRSQKNICSLLQMLDTNLLKPLRCWHWIQESGLGATYFSVSTDKAADPTNMMGASKRIMEQLMFSDEHLLICAERTTSSRFANVAFSNGSLLESFVLRFEKRQALACPRDTSRFFISLREAGQICLLAAVCGPNRHILIPRLDPQTDVRSLEDIAAAFLRVKGLEPEIYDDEQAARSSVDSDLLRHRYPLLLTSLDTEGEKPCETFFGANEKVMDLGMSSIQAVCPNPIETALLVDFLREIELLVSNSEIGVDKNHIVEAVSRVVPEFHHVQRRYMLDGRM
jgi:FlaA1/EpsC-like NDP-sugar epimerase